MPIFDNQQLNAMQAEANRKGGQQAVNIGDKSDTFLDRAVVFISINFLNACFEITESRCFRLFFVSFGLIGTLFGRNHHF